MKMSPPFCNVFRVRRRSRTDEAFGYLSRPFRSEDEPLAAFVRYFPEYSKASGVHLNATVYLENLSC